MSDKIGSDIILLKSTASFADTGNNYTAYFKHAWRYTEGIFTLAAEQDSGTYSGGDKLRVWVMSYNTYTLSWHVIGQFTQITDATTALEETIERPYGLGRWLSCKWETDGVTSTTDAYTFSVSGSVK